MEGRNADLSANAHIQSAARTRRLRVEIGVPEPGTGISFPKIHHRSPQPGSVAAKACSHDRTTGVVVASTCSSATPGFWRLILVIQRVMLPRSKYSQERNIGIPGIQPESLRHPSRTPSTGISRSGRPSRSASSPTAGYPEGCGRWSSFVRCSPNCTLSPFATRSASTEAGHSSTPIGGRRTLTATNGRPSPCSTSSRGGATRCGKPGSGARMPSDHMVIARFVAWPSRPCLR